MIQKIYAGRILKPALHVLFWTLVIVAPYFFRNPNTWVGQFSAFQYRIMIGNALLAALFYFNLFFLYPVLCKRRSVWIYIPAVVVVITGMIFLSRYIDSLLHLEPPHPPREARSEMRGFGSDSMRRRFGPDSVMRRHFNRDSAMRRHFKRDSAMFSRFGNDSSMRGGMRHGGPEGGNFATKGDFGGRPFGGPRFRMIDRGWNGWYFSNILLYLCIIGTSISYSIISDNAEREKIRKEKENENLRTELSFLRSQVSPHFIFNVLNNLVALARKKSDVLESSLIELSGLMRYMLYENDEEQVSLTREVEYLKSYIALQTLRFGDDVTITFNPPKNTDHYYIEPMLLAPFVENAFKHGGDVNNEAFINITLEISQNGWLDFKVMNSMAPRQQSKDKTSGIGLVNVRRRLELLYHGNFELETTNNGSIFIAHLKIKLNG